MRPVIPEVQDCRWWGWIYLMSREASPQGMYIIPHMLWEISRREYIIACVLAWYYILRIPQCIAHVVVAVVHHSTWE
jgi:hypothetical protein